MGDPIRHMGRSDKSMPNKLDWRKVSLIRQWARNHASLDVDIKKWCLSCKSKSCMDFSPFIVRISQMFFLLVHMCFCPQNVLCCMCYCPQNILCSFVRLSLKCSLFACASFPRMFFVRMFFCPQNVLWSHVPLSPNMFFTLVQHFMINLFNSWFLLTWLSYNLLLFNIFCTIRIIVFTCCVCLIPLPKDSCPTPRRTIPPSNNLNDKPCVLCVYVPNIFWLTRFSGWEVQSQLWRPLVSKF